MLPPNPRKIGEWVIIVVAAIVAIFVVVMLIVNMMASPSPAGSGPADSAASQLN